MDSKPWATRSDSEESVAELNRIEADSRNPNSSTADQSQKQSFELKHRGVKRNSSKIHLNMDDVDMVGDDCDSVVASPTSTTMIEQPHLLTQSCSTASDDSGIIDSNNYRRENSLMEDLKRSAAKRAAFERDQAAHHQAEMVTNQDQESPPSEERRDSDVIEKVFDQLGHWYRMHRLWFYLLAMIAYNCFFVYAINRTWHRTPSFCQGVKLLSILTIITYTLMLYHLVLKPHLFIRLYKKWEAGDCCFYFDLSPQSKMTLKIVAWIAVISSIAGFIVYNAWHEKERLFSGAGYLGFILLGFIFSKHRKAIKWNQILWGLTMQLTFGIIVLRTSGGKMVFACIGEKINTFLEFTTAGTEMVFGYLATGALKGPSGNFTITLAADNQSVNGQIVDMPMPIQNTIFAFSSMPVVIFFSFFVSILYFYGIMQAIVKQLGWLLQVTIGTTACESISASGNIFLGMTESPLLVKPFLPIMTKSELHAVLTGGFATIAGSVMAAYISFGISASHLLSASVMAAPSALALSKLMYPEVEQSKTSADDIQLEKGSERNAIEAGSNGASSAIKLVANIMANLIAFMAFLAFLDSIIGWIGEMVDIPSLSFKMIMSKLFIPIALMLGIEWQDCEEVASLIGLKMVINEFVAYQELSKLIAVAGTISARSQTIVTFALCSFANISSIGIQVGGLSAMAPGRKSDLAQLAVRAMITGSMASFMTACVAGMLS